MARSKYLSGENEINKIRSDAARLKEILIDHTSFELVEDEVWERLIRLNSSDHLAWTNKKLNELRLDFLQSCGWAIRNRKIYPSVQEDKDTRQEINTIAQELDNALKKLGK